MSKQRQTERSRVRKAQEPTIQSPLRVTDTPTPHQEQLEIGTMPTQGTQTANADVLAIIRLMQEENAAQRREDEARRREDMASMQQQFMALMTAQQAQEAERRRVEDAQRAEERRIELEQRRLEEMQRAEERKQEAEARKEAAERRDAEKRIERIQRDTPRMAPMRAETDVKEFIEQFEMICS